MNLLDTPIPLRTRNIGITCDGGHPGLDMGMTPLREHVIEPYDDLPLTSLIERLSDPNTPIETNALIALGVKYAIALRLGVLDYRPAVDGFFEKNHLVKRGEMDRDLWTYFAIQHYARREGVDDIGANFERDPKKGSDTIEMRIGRSPRWEQYHQMLEVMDLPFTTEMLRKIITGSPELEKEDITLNLSSNSGIFLIGHSIAQRRRYPGSTPHIIGMENRRERAERLKGLLGEKYARIISPEHPENLRGELRGIIPAMTSYYDYPTREDPHPVELLWGTPEMQIRGMPDQDKMITTPYQGRVPLRQVGGYLLASSPWEYFGEVVRWYADMVTYMIRGKWLTPSFPFSPQMNQLRRTFR